MSAIPAFLGLLAMLAPLDDAHADELFLEGGGKIKGTIVQANGNIVIVQRRTGGIQQIVRKLISEISVDLENGQTLVGDFGGWSNGVLQLQTDAGPVRIRSGQILDGPTDPVETASLGSPSADIALATPLSTADRSYVPPPIFRMSKGATIVGRPMAFQSPLLTIRRASGGQQTLRVDDMEEVVIRGADGSSITGEFIGWDDGVFELRIDNQLAQVSHGAVLNEANGDVSIGGPLEDLSKQAVDGTVVAAVTPEAESGDDGADGGNADDAIVLSVTNEPAVEGDAAMLFAVNLSRPTPRDLIIIYTTLVETAGKDDFTQGSGVVKIKAGSDSGEISIPLVDDDLKEGDESVSLFLSSDPKLVTMASNRIAATIKDND